MTDNWLKTVSKTDDELRVANYIILFGGRDLTGEFFTKSTEIESSYTKSGVLHVDFEHGLDPDRVGMGAHDVLGYVDWKTAKVDETGVFVERALNRRARYMSKIENLIENGVIGTSSEAIRGKSKRTGSGEITEWPLVRDTLTFTPAEPRMLASNVLSVAKSLYEAFPDSKSLSIVESLHGIKAEIEKAESLKAIEEVLESRYGLSQGESCALVARIKSLSGGDRRAKQNAAEIAEIFQRYMG